MALKIFFMGTGSFAVPSLKAVKEAGHEVLAVICQPDRPKGRGHHLQAPETKQAALAMGLKVLQYEKVKDLAAVREILDLGAQAGCVAAYGQILSQELLSGPSLGCVNVHASLLPKYRGAAPVAWALAEGENETGVTVQKIAARLDTGDILGQKRAAILDQDDAASLTARLADLGAGLLKETLAALESGRAEARPQEEKDASLAPLIKKSDGAVDFHWSARKLERRCRAFRNWPGFYCFFNGKPLRLHEVRPAEGAAGGTPGEILDITAAGWLVACGEKERVLVNQVQEAGGIVMNARDFARGHRVERGALLRAS